MSRGEVPIVVGRSWREIDLEAHGLLKRFYPQCLDEPQAVPAEHFVEIVLQKHLGICVEVAPLPAPTEAITTPGIPGDKTSPPKIILTPTVFDALLEGNRRARFTGIHEAYHGIAHSRQLKQDLVSGSFQGLHRIQSVPPYRNPERQADVFASRFLMPTHAMRLALQYFDPTTDLNALANLFQVSREAMKYRLGDFGFR